MQRLPKYFCAAVLALTLAGLAAGAMAQSGYPRKPKSSDSLCAKGTLMCSATSPFDSAG